MAATFVVAVAVPAAFGAAAGSGVAATYSPSGSKFNCGNGGRFLCTEVGDSEQAFGEDHYVGHDEPSVLFYSNQKGSGYRMQYSGIIPSDPAPTNDPGKHTYNFQLYAAFWYGLAMCDTQSYPEQLSTCPADSNSNIAAPGDPKHAGSAYEELQFYPPGYVQQWNGFSCSPTQWCVALTIDSYARNPVTGLNQNDTCLAKIGSPEYVNFAYLTHSGVPQGPPNPVNFDPIASGTPDPSKVVFLNPGDHYTVTLHDTPNGLETDVHDLTTNVTGKMTASAANGFGQVKYDPNPGTSCVNIPYNFHPMYATSTTQTTVPWAAATYNVAFDTEVGHFDYCSKVDATTGNCTGTEGAAKSEGPGGSKVEATDADDNGCWPPAASGLIKIGGCEGSNLGYDGTSYIRDWPNGNTSNRPGPTIFTSPLTGGDYDSNYQTIGFNTDLPDIESQIGTCDRATGLGCTIVPPTDDNNTLAAAYPYYTTGDALGGCAWTVGQVVPGFTEQDFDRNAEYGSLLAVTYPGPTGPVTHINDYQQILNNNPCPSGADR